ncbi:putative glutamate-tRNA synthetase [Clavispora lusitaniae]|uniref:Glutamate-tRNA synthetase n=1 Tax=Clavispora lusitaniae TaxID=36911 RepID=A0ACD0WNF7_CLALS|nr:putative glutamate-tRNA synthetase [Clavispora lusitaniae]QFZ34670.1 putative glutamate-tRNA synthetase [Clavispora lusitaniae]QFZ40355.1 putative glutamate-tRNA synthetase [Clavispora lusitaniae]QFZ46035.1 putative glutamate-tRNA synthetase [Clavispora lusitaniae]QFZ51697.1 putative glutamate-tRNA synthetase [Clavispora lusitaniae]
MLFHSTTMATLTVAAKAPFIPYSTIIASEFVKAETDVSLTVEFVDEKSVESGSDATAKLVVGEKTYSGELESLKGLAALIPSISSSVDSSLSWVEFALGKLANKNFKALAADLEKLDAHLNFRSFIVGYSYSLADIAVWGVLRANAVMGSVIKNAVYSNISRWYSFIALDSKFDVADKTTKSINELRKNLKAAKGEKKEGHKANFAIDLPNAQMGKVVTRFPPEPSGYLHIGHAKAAVLNEYFAHTYKGKLIIRFDDTNPTKERIEFQDSIIEDLALLGIKGDQVTYSSDYFGQMYELALKMIKDGNAYCDDTPLEKMREERMVGEPSARRDRSVEENLRVFTEEMKNGTEEGLKNCLRAKIDYKDLNKAMRDPVIYRCNLTPHHRTGTKWKMYPTYDFCVPVVDSIEGVTHALRTNEYRDRNPQYEWIQNALKLRHVDIWDFGRVNFVRTLLSKRKLQWFVDKGYVGNWDDPRFPTVRGVRRRGMTVEGLRNFIIAQGPSRNIINLDWSSIWALNKKVIDPVAPRHTAVDAENVVPVKLSNGPAEPYSEEKPKHKKNPEVGLKKVIYAKDVLVDQADAQTFAEGEEITFMDWGNVIIKKIHKEGDIVKSIDAELHLEGDFRKTEKKVTWLADTPDKVKVKLVDFDHLITKDKLEEGDNFEDFITPETEFPSQAIADVNVRSLKKGDIIQFERKGYFRVDKDLSDGDEVVLFTIPDGKTASKKK